MQSSKGSLKTVYFTNPVTITLFVLLLTTVITHVADYFINVALNKDTVWGMYNYSLPLVVNILLFALFLFITLKIRSHKTTNILSDKELSQRSFGSTPVSVALITLIVASIASNALYRLFQYVGDRHMNYSIQSLKKINSLEIFIFLAWIMICLFYFFTNKSVGNVILSIISMATAYVAFHFLFVVDIVQKVKDGTTLEDYVQNKMIQDALEDAGIGKLIALTSLPENSMSIVYKFIFYVAIILTLLNFRILKKRAQNPVANIISSTATIIAALLLLISLTPLTDIITTGLAILINR
ncbi:MAG: hypothetical protein K6A29_00795 [Lachnospiraceae bacterium]|nr:hypothetical protein [Lachnospiraceae bacterium]